MIPFQFGTQNLIHCIYESKCFLLQEFLSDREQGHGKLNMVAASGELLMSIAANDRAESVRAKINTTREDWKTLMTNLHQRETALQVSDTMRDHLIINSHTFINLLTSVESETLDCGQ